MRLLLLTQDFPPDTGGIQTYSAELGQQFHHLCDWFGVMAPDVSGADAVDLELPHPVYRIPSTYNTFAAKSVPHLLRLVREQEIDTVFHAQWQTLPASLVTRLFTGRPTGIFSASHGRELLLNPFARIPLLDRGFERFQRMILQRADGLFPVSQFTASLLHASGVPAAKVFVHNNGTDPDRFRPVDGSNVRASLDIKNHPTLLTVGRLVPRKGIDTVLRALPRLRTIVPDVVYVIAGDGPDRRRLEKLARRLGVRENTRFAGRVPHDRLVEYYSACDVFVLTARTLPPSVEGFGIVFLEANACEKPVIGSRSGGIPDAVEEGETGYLIDPGEVDQLVEKAAYLLKHPEQARQMGIRGRERVLTSYTWEKVAERLYRTLATLASPAATG